MHTIKPMTVLTLLMLSTTSLLSTTSIAASPVTNFEYDANGNLTKITDGLGHATVQQYDALNRRIQQIQPNPNSTGQLGTILTQYNAIDQVTSVTDPRNLATTYTPNAFGEVLTQTSPDTGATINTYDNAGNIKTRQDAKGQLTTYSYDVLNRITQAQYADGKVITYTYDQGTNGAGRLTGMTDPAGITAYEYDSRGHIVNEVRIIKTITYLTTYVYNSTGQLDGVAYPTGLFVTYTRDWMGRINQVTCTKNNQTQILANNISYQPFGGVKSFTFGNGAVYSRGFDTDNRLNSYTLSDKTIGLTYDNASRITAATNLASPTFSKTYAYDNLDHLTGFVAPLGSQGYGYDLTGNRTSVTIGVNSYSNMVASNSNRLNSVTGPAAKTFTFDNNGSVTSAGSVQYNYDARGRLQQSTVGAVNVDYGVNALGQRVYKTTTSASTVYHYDLNGQVIAETDGLGAIKQEIIYLGNIPLAVIQ